MRADRAELSWDDKKAQWLLRITIGEEVIRRHIKSPKDADMPGLERQAVQIAGDEGYDLDPAHVAFKLP